MKEDNTSQFKKFNLKQIAKTALKIFLYSLGSIILLLIAFLFSLQIPSFQQLITNKVVNYVAGKTGTNLRINKLYIDFPTTVILEGVFAEDLKKDTLINLQKLEIKLAMMDLMNAKLSVSRLDLEGLTARINRTLPDSSFNFDFFIEAFAGKKENPAKEIVDTTNGNFTIRVDDIHLKDLNLRYDDAVSGMFANAKIGKLDLGMEEIDLKNMRFRAKELLLSKTDGIFEIRKTNVSKPSNSASLLPELSLKKLTINKVNFGFHNLPDASFFDFKVGKLEINPHKIDLNGENIELQNLLLHQSDIKIAMEEKPAVKDDSNQISSEPSNWKATVQKIDLADNAFRLDFSNAPKVKAGIDYKHLKANAINLQASKVSYSPKLIEGQIKQLSLSESCGLNIKQFKADFEYDSIHAHLSNLLLKTNKTQIASLLSAKYPSIKSLTETPGNLEINANLDSTKIDMQDVLLFAPDLIKQEIIYKNRNQVVSINGKLTGKLKDLLAQNLDIRTANNTQIALSGKLKGLPDANKLFFDLNLKSLKTSKSDLSQMLPKTMLPDAIQIPNQVLVTGKVKGSLQNMLAQIKLNSSDGFVSINGSYSEKSNIPHYNADVVLKDFNAGKILKQSPLLGKVTGNISAKGSSFKPEKVVAELSGKIRKLELKGYAYENINLKTKAVNGIYQSNITIADPNLSLDMDATASLKKDSEFARLNLNLKNADLKALNFYKTDLKASGQIIANIGNFDLKKMVGKLSIKDLLLLKEGQEIALDSILATMENDSLKHTISINSDVLDLNYAGTTSVDEVIPALQTYLDRQMGNVIKINTKSNAAFTCDIEIKPHPIFKDVLLPQMTAFSGLTITSKFNNQNQNLNLQAKSELIQYGDNVVNEFELNVDANSRKADYKATVQKIQSGNILIPKTELSGSLKDKILEFALLVAHPDSGKRLDIKGSVNQQIAKETSIQLTGGNVIIDNRNWKIENDNNIKISPGGLNIQKLGLELDGQFIKVQSINPNPNAPIDIQFQKFELGTISRIIEKDTALVRGLIDGNVHIQKLSPFAFTSNLRISDIAFREIPIGNLKIKADNLIADRYTASIILDGDSNDIKLTGFYQKEILDLDLNINKLKLKSLESFASDYIKKSSGFLTGKLKINGKATEPKLDGNIGFNKATFTLVAINNQLLLKDENIGIDNKGIHFKNFTVLDSDQQPLEVNGSVLSSDFKSLKFDLDVRTKNFTALRTTAKDNPAYYGTMTLNSTIQIRGNQNLPIVTADAQLLEGSTFTFVVLEGDLNTSLGENVVVFEDSAGLAKAPKDTVKMQTEFKGIDLSANIDVSKKSVFRVIVDPVSGDNLEVSGDANLAFGIDQSGKVSLSGVYTLNDGHYQASFQKVLKREFKMKSGSRISWSGDPMDGQIDLTAIYKTEAAATDLMSSELAGMSDNERAAYRKLLTYLVNLKVEGPITKPQLSFALDMAQEDQGAFGGLVYSKINLLNTDPNELNKQVFSLLVLNKFLPSGNAGSSGGAAVSTIARNSVNQMLSDQLNALSGKYVKGAALNFNLQTTEDFVGGSAQQNTALQVGLKKELFNSRLSLQVGSSIDLSGSNRNTSNSNGQSLTGDVLVEYKLTTDGRYKLKAFRENQYEGVIDGILYKTGLGIAYTRDYNRFRELWKSPAKPKDK